MLVVMSMNPISKGTCTRLSLRSGYRWRQMVADAGRIPWIRETPRPGTGRFRESMPGRGFLREILMAAAHMSRAGLDERAKINDIVSRIST
jgi:hypothetical protein